MTTRPYYIYGCFTIISGEGVKFCRTFIRATFNRLIEKPYITLSPGAESASVILVDILQYAAVNDKKTQQAVEMAEAVSLLFFLIFRRSQDCDFKIGFDSCEG